MIAVAGSWSSYIVCSYYLHGVTTLSTMALIVENSVRPDFLIGVLEVANVQTIRIESSNSVEKIYVSKSTSFISHRSIYTEGFIIKSSLYIDKMAPFITLFLFFIRFREVSVQRSCTSNKLWTVCSTTVSSIADAARICPWRRWRRCRIRYFRWNIVWTRNIRGRVRPTRTRYWRSRPNTTRSFHSLSTRRRVTVHHNTWHDSVIKWEAQLIHIHWL